ncbi:MAG: bifunctional metallophosphatase/5'-nucleotidase [Prevotella sp.]|nr:bifunctional metallophosphatase/5'-nucleotidase [Prevotella sp.]
MKKLLLNLVLLAPLFGSSHAVSATIGTDDEKSIVILYENDVHCAIDGYKRLAGLRDAIVQSDTAWVAIVSNGDYLQGATAGALSHGQYIIDVMRTVGYDAITLGNHEFDYGVPRMKELLAQMNAPVLCCNLFDPLSIGGRWGAPHYGSYVIRSYGNRKIAFIGVTTPESMVAESYSFFDSNGQLLYDLRNNDLALLVQTAVDRARSAGADYVVVLSHLGEEQPVIGLSSHQLIAATSGIDVLLDGHSHSVIEHVEVANMEGRMVPVSQTGTQFQNVGKLVISTDGHINTSLIPVNEITYENQRVSAAIDSVRREVERVTARQVSRSDFLLTINDAAGERLVRLGETNLADLVTDAFRHSMQAEIGLCNGGGIRTNIPAGTITYGNVVDVLPFDNHMAKIEATGKEITTMLEWCTATLPTEEGQFPQVSGLRFTIHLQSHTITDVTVLDQATNTWKPIDPEHRYTVATSDYYLGGGFYDTLKGCTQLTLSSKLTRDALAEYLENTLGGSVPDIYQQSQSRITIVND